MGILGTNANPGKAYSLADIAEMGATWTRTILYAGQEDALVEWAVAAELYGIEVQPIVICQYVTEWQPGWRRRQLQPYAEALAELCYRNPGLFKHAFIGNEPNGTGGASTQMSPRDFEEWLIAFSAALAPAGAKCISGALSGPKEYLQPLLSTLRRTCVAVGVDPYTYTAETLDGMVDELAAYTGLPVAVGEIGIETLRVDETTGEQVEACPEPDQAAYIGSLVTWAQQRAARDDRLYQFGIFCQGDDDVLGFGLQRADGSRKPSYDAYQQAASAPQPTTEEPMATLDQVMKQKDWLIGPQYKPKDLPPTVLDGPGGQVVFAWQNDGVGISAPNGEWWQLCHTSPESIAAVLSRMTPAQRQQILEALPNS